MSRARDSKRVVERGRGRERGNCVCVCVWKCFCECLITLSCGAAATVGGAASLSPPPSLLLPPLLLLLPLPLPPLLLLAAKKRQNVMNKICNKHKEEKYANSLTRVSMCVCVCVCALPQSPCVSVCVCEFLSRCVQARQQQSNAHCTATILHCGSALGMGQSESALVSAPT